MKQSQQLRPQWCPCRWKLCKLSQCIEIFIKLYHGTRNISNTDAFWYNNGTIGKLLKRHWMTMICSNKAYILSTGVRRTLSLNFFQFVCSALLIPWRLFWSENSMCVHCLVIVCALLQNRNKCDVRATFEAQSCELHLASVPPPLQKGCVSVRCTILIPVQIVAMYHNHQNTFTLTYLKWICFVWYSLALFISSAVG